jgi:hypothetical protein
MTAKLQDFLIAVRNRSREEAILSFGWKDTSNLEGLDFTLSPRVAPRIISFPLISEPGLKDWFVRNRPDVEEAARHVEAAGFVRPNLEDALDFFEQWLAQLQEDDVWFATSPLTFRQRRFAGEWIPHLHAVRTGSEWVGVERRNWDASFYGFDPFVDVYRTVPLQSPELSFRFDRIGPKAGKLITPRLAFVRPV